ncbi:MAG: type I methionyl aminopeptidase [Candidatus Sumerlaeota bacterium]|nr:type I methionyl aminopeptidase [Candidatus Sumerlaeota bacterium]
MGWNDPHDHRVEVKGPADLERMRRAGSILRVLCDEVARRVQPGIPTEELDRVFARGVERFGAKSAFYGLYGFPGHICVSINEEVVHGIPSPKRFLQEGDIVSLDMGLVLDGFCSDTAISLPVGEVNEEKKRLLATARRALALGIQACRAGNRLGDVGAAIQQCAEAAGFTVVREYTGHGIGRALHEPPKAPNFGTLGKGPRLQAGWVLALEPMINAGTWRVETLDDQWTVVTQDRRPSAHFEHTVAITVNGAEVLT